jgi:hypothetical protein
MFNSAGLLSRSRVKGEQADGPILQPHERLAGQWAWRQPLQVGLSRRGLSNPPKLAPKVETHTAPQGLIRSRNGNLWARAAGLHWRFPRTQCNHLTRNCSSGTSQQCSALRPSMRCGPESALLRLADATLVGPFNQESLIGSERPRNPIHATR